MHRVGAKGIAGQARNDSSIRHCEGAARSNPQADMTLHIFY